MWTPRVTFTLCELDVTIERMLKHRNYYLHTTSYNLEKKKYSECHGVIPHRRQRFVWIFFFFLFYFSYLFSVAIIYFYNEIFLKQNTTIREDTDNDQHTHSISKVETSQLQHTLLSNIYLFNITLLRIRRYNNVDQKKSILLFTFLRFFFFFWFNKIWKRFLYCDDLKYHHHFLWQYMCHK